MLKQCPDCGQDLRPGATNCTLCGWVDETKQKAKWKKSWDDKRCSNLSCGHPVTIEDEGRFYCRYHHKNKNNPYLFKLVPDKSELYGDPVEKKILDDCEEKGLTQQPGESREEWLTRLRLHRQESIRRGTANKSRMQAAISGKTYSQDDEFNEKLPF